MLIDPCLSPRCGDRSATHVRDGNGDRRRSRIWMARGDEDVSCKSRDGLHSCTHVVTEDVDGQDTELADQLKGLKSVGQSVGQTSVNCRFVGHVLEYLKSHLHY
jgi:hypothetical protein